MPVKACGRKHQKIHRPTFANRCISHPFHPSNTKKAAQWPGRTFTGSTEWLCEGSKTDAQANGGLRRRQPNPACGDPRTAITQHTHRPSHSTAAPPTHTTFLPCPQHELSAGRLAASSPHSLPKPIHTTLCVLHIASHFGFSTHFCFRARAFHFCSLPNQIAHPLYLTCQSTPRGTKIKL